MPDNIEPQDMTDEQLDALLDETTETEDGLLDDSPVSIEEDDPADDDGKAEEDADGEEADGDDDEEAEEDEAKPDADEEEDDEEEDEDDSSENIRAVLVRLEDLETRNEKLQADLDRANLLRDRAAGRAGSLKQKLAKGKDPDEFEDDDDDDDEETRRSQSKGKSEAQEALDEIRAEKVERAMGSAASDFYDANMPFFKALAEQVSPEANQEFQAELVAQVQKAQADLGEDILTMSPKMAAKLSDTLLRSAFADMKLKLVQDLKKQASDQSDESRRKIRERKKGAAGARSNKRPAAKSSPKPKSAKEMSDKELDAALAQAARSGSFD